MKILSVRFKNLNSLVGEWEIDFTHPEYQNNGIFAITGPTGAGKTTILDAICLALYGRTPRLNAISKTENEILSRQSADCFAEVTFETNNGCFRATWNQRKARNNPGGALQAPSHRLANAETNEFFPETNLREVGKRIVQETGMDFDQFTRAMLLAQGEFSKFLQASASARAPLLEKITGTKLYADISSHVFMRYKEEKTKADLLRNDLAGITVFSQEEEEAKKTELNNLQTSLKKAEEDIAANKIRIDWLTGIQKLEDSLALLQKNSQTLSKAIEEFAPLKLRLEKSLRAQPLQSLHAALKLKREQNQNNVKILEECRGKVPEVQKNLASSLNSLSEAEKKAQEAHEKRETEGRLIQETRSLDQKITSIAQNLVQEKKRLTEAMRALEASKKELTLQKNTITSLKKEQASLNAYFEEHPHDQSLVTDLSAIEARADALFKKEGERKKLEGDILCANKKLEEARARLNKANLALEKKDADLEKNRTLQKDNEEALAKALGEESVESLEEKRRLHEREKLMRERFASLEDYRKQLQDNAPCPLCGSLHHPFACGNVPDVSEEEKKIQAIDALLNTVKTLRKKGEDIQKKQILLERDKAKAEQEKIREESSAKIEQTCLEQLQETLEKNRTDLEEAFSALTSQLSLLGEVLPKEGQSDGLRTCLTTLRNRVLLWQKKQTQKTAVETGLATTETRVQGLENTLLQQEKVVKDEEELCQKLQNEHNTEQKKRLELFGQKDPDMVEKELKKACDTAMLAVKKAQETHNALKQDETRLQTLLNETAGRIEKERPELEKLASDFQKAMEEQGFSQESDFLGACLEVAKQRELQNREKELDRQKSTLEARISDLRSHIDQEKEKHITEEKLDDLNTKSKTLETERTDLQKKEALLGEAIRTNVLKKEERKKKEEQTDKQALREERWGKLNKLIGSQDGHAYRNFVQGLTFELMIQYANRELRKMTDRYVLTKHEANPLELCVVDQYQAGLQRTTKNLSGGESFLVSLSLALGLAQMASNSVRVDSLFLDEGFGTLDEEALEMALETLAGLQQEGKTIGVISHVSALKDRISTQIQVVPLRAGRSALRGAGCRKLG